VQKNNRNVHGANTLSDRGGRSKRDLLRRGHIMQLLQKVVATGFSDDLAVYSLHQS